MLTYFLFFNRKTRNLIPMEMTIIADRKTLEQVEGIGKNKAKNIYHFFRRSF
jgi:ERCC4-type nuclease